MGEGLPVRALGFPNLEAFLSSIPDVCSIQWRGASLTVLGVASQGTAHIQVQFIGQYLFSQFVQDMIDRQSNKKGGGGKKSGGRRFGGGGRSYGGGGGGSMRRGWDWGGDDDYYDPYRTSDFDIIGGLESFKAVPEPCYPLSEPATKAPQPKATNMPKQQHSSDKQPEVKKRELPPSELAQVKRTLGGFQVWGGRVESLLQNRPHGLFQKMLEKMYEKAWGEALPQDWLDEMEGMKKVAVERKANSINPICSIPTRSVDNDAKAAQNEGDCMPVLGAWDIWEVVVSGVWQDEEMLGVNIMRLRDKDELETLQKEMQAHYSKESNRKSLGARGKEGSLVAVLHQSSWCRGRLVSKAGNSVIYLVDTGKDVPLPVLPQSKVFKLCSQFSNLPAAAVGGELGGVKLMGAGGGQAALDWLEAKLIGEQKVFKAEVRWRLGKHLSLSLTDPSMPASTANIGQQLIKCGLVVTAPC